jgi:hypothetical protein
MKTQRALHTALSQPAHTKKTQNGSSPRALKNTNTHKRKRTHTLTHKLKTGKWGRAGPCAARAPKSGRAARRAPARLPLPGRPPGCRAPRRVAGPGRQSWLFWPRPSTQREGRAGDDVLVQARRWRGAPAGQQRVVRGGRGARQEALDAGPGAGGARAVGAVRADGGRVPWVFGARANCQRVRSGSEGLARRARRAHTQKSQLTGPPLPCSSRT